MNYSNSKIVQGAVFLLAVLLTACGGGATDDGKNTPGNPAPTVSSASPANNATDVAVNAAITATFSESMDVTTVSSTTFTLSNGVTGNVSGNVSCDGRTATFTPQGGALASGTTYTATISTGVKSAGKTAMASPYTWTFTTGTAQDNIPPTVTSTFPISGALGIATNAEITATFSESMNATSVTTAGNFTLQNTNTSASVTGTVNYSGTTATFKPSSTLAASTQYTATITNTVKDLAGNAMTSVRTWSFTTTANGTVSTNGWLYTKPNDTKIYVNNGSGEQVWVGRGANIDDLFLGGYNDTLQNGAAAEQGLKDATAILVNDWKANFIRVNLGMYSYKTVSWLTNPAEYKTPMENVINALLAQPNVYVLVTLRSDTSMDTCNIPTSYGSDDARCVPTANTDAVYRALVDSFADKPNVMFGVSNEPGGNSNTDAQLRAAMSRAVDVIRAREDQLGVPHHIVAVQGNDWTSRINFYHTTPLTQDKVVYEYHAYPPISSCTQTDCYAWSNIPIIIGEYGGASMQGMSQSAANTFFADVEARQISTLAWSFSPYSNVAPDLLNVTRDGKNISPNAWGNIVKAYLLSHAP